jgi:alkyl hydroperoxide reductase subunit AhpC
MAALVRADYPLLADPTKETSISYGVFDLLGDGVAAPAVFVINPDRSIRWAYVGSDIDHRPATADIFARIRN